MAQHPYYPRTLSFPDYVPPSYTPLGLVAILGGISTAALSLGWSLMTRLNPTLTIRAKATASWFLYCGLLHIHFEGYFVKYHRTLTARTDLTASLWKEYAQSDSRYLTEDSFVIGIEKLTVLFLGPLCLLTFLAIVFENPQRHPARLLACSMHVYGVLMYFSTAAGSSHCRPEALYFWGYYVACNAPWLVVPAVLGWRSFWAMTEAAAAVAKGRRRPGIKMG